MMAPQKMAAGLMASLVLLGGAAAMAAQVHAFRLLTGENNPTLQQAIWYSEDCDDPKNDLSGCRGS